MHKFLFLLVSLVFLGIGCGDDADFSDTNNSATATAEGAVANNAEEAWPLRGSVPSPLTRAMILDVCVAWSACDQFKRIYTEDAEAELAVDTCTGAMIFWGERATPLGSFLPSANERAEFFAECVLSDPTSCASVDACLTERVEGIECQEDGCRSSTLYDITCEGDVALIPTDDGVVRRDCSRAFAQCDEESETGCSDRPFSQCPSDGDRGDRCDGNVRLGCDGYDQVSYRDCERLGGVCGEVEEGGFDCIYALEEGDVSCDEVSLRCEGDELVACLLGAETRTSAPHICPN